MSARVGRLADPHEDRIAALVGGARYHRACPRKLLLLHADLHVLGYRWIVSRRRPVAPSHVVVLRKGVLVCFVAPRSAWARVMPIRMHPHVKHD